MDSIYGHGLLKAKDYDLYRRFCWNNSTAVLEEEICDLVYLSAYYSSFNTNVYGLDWPQCPFEVDWLSTISDHGYHRHFGSKKTVFQRASHLHFKAMKALERVLAHRVDGDAADLESDKFMKFGISRIPIQELSALHSELKDMFDSNDSDNFTDLESESDLDLKSNLESDRNRDRRRLRRRREDIFPVDKGEDDGYVPCLDRHMKLYLRMEEVQEAIHVKRYLWGDCALKVIKMWPEADYYSFMQRYYEWIIEDYSMKYNLSLVLYSGTAFVVSHDASCCDVVMWTGF